MYTLRKEEVNERGFLSNPEEWTPTVASALAEAEGVVLTDTHWVVLNAIRAFYAENEAPVSYHVLCQEIDEVLRPLKYNCVHAMKQLFPRGGIKQASRIAGVPDYFCFGC